MLLFILFPIVLGILISSCLSAGFVFNQISEISLRTG
jgi:hypothetical protein